MVRGMCDGRIDARAVFLRFQVGLRMTPLPSIGMRIIYEKTHLATSEENHA